MQTGTKRKAFMITADAVLCFLILVALLGSIRAEENVTLNHELLYQQAQDLVEVCTILEKIDNSCFDYVKKMNLSYCLGDCENPMIYRDYIKFNLAIK